MLKWSRYSTIIPFQVWFFTLCLCIFGEKKDGFYFLFCFGGLNCLLPNVDFEKKREFSVVEKLKVKKPNWLNVLK